jgi:hypothetical protein
VYVAYTKDSHYISQLAEDIHVGQLILLEVWNLLTHSPLSHYDLYKRAEPSLAQLR